MKVLSIAPAVSASINVGEKGENTIMKVLFCIFS